jgi:putative DNA primase/helicase
MIAKPSYQTNRPFTPEERSSYMSWKFGGTLDWCNLMLCEINYPIAELRWFVDAVQGLCKGKEKRIAHSTIAKRAQRFKNKPQASDLTRRAIEANNEWARTHRCMIFDIERPKPGEMEGKDKRARTKYTDYLTPAAVWAQETAHKVKKADEVRWNKDAKYRCAKQQEILAEALKMLPTFERVADMPGTDPKDPQPLSVSEYVEQREKILLAENRRVLDRVCDGELTDIDEIDSRLATLEVFHQRALHELEKSYQSARDVLLGLKKTRLTRAVNFTGADEVMAEFDEKVAQKGVADLTLVDAPNDTQAGQIGAPEKGKTDDPLLDPATTLFDHQKGKTGLTLVASVADCETDSSGTSIDSSTNGYLIFKGKTDDPLSVPPVEDADDEFEEFTTGTDADARDHQAEGLLTMEEAAVSLAADFKVIPNYAPTTDGGCTCKKGRECPSAGKHPIFSGWDDPKSPNCATNDVRKIRAWWRQHPNANIGNATGELGGIVALDVDFPKGGDVGLTTLLERLGLDQMPPTLVIKTGAGVQFYFAYDSDDIKNSASKIAPGIDVRGAGGQVVTAPSLHRSGRRYMFANNLKPAPLPEALRAEMLKVSRKEVKPADRTLRTSVPPHGAHFPSATRIFPEGERNDGIRDVSYGRWLNGLDASESEHVSQMLRVNATRCNPPLAEEEVIELARRTARNFARGERPQQQQQQGASSSI